MKKAVLFLSGFFTVALCDAQGLVGINTESPQALLDIHPQDSLNPEREVGLIVSRVLELPAASPGAEQHGMPLFVSKPNSADYW
ncbi:MAG: hypothetical protein LBQ73_06835, partial [Tannerellaceae bacterium]|nr:hypothetical protein [Tannerellaceae bacterium]